MKPVTKFISPSFFRKIRENIPVVCVDLVVVSGKEFFLVKRKNKPEKNTWFFPGGRIYKNETLLAAAKRKLKEETGLSSSKMRPLGVYEFFAKDSVFTGVSTHTVDMVFYAPVSKKHIKLDSQSSEGQWFTKIGKDFHPELKEYLKKVGFK